MVSVVLQESSNNFTNLDQNIDSRPIASIIYSPMTPEESNVNPKRSGEMYIQISEGSPEHKLRMWIGVSVTGNSFTWEEATGVTTPLPDTVARTDKVNDFQPYEQTISGHQILSFVDGGDKTPGESGLPAAYDGQFYIAVKTLGDKSKDVGIWVAHSNLWLPIVKEGVDTTNLAKLDSTNVFSEVTQLLGPAEDGRLIGATRIKRGVVSPIADAAWLAKIEGEQTIFFNTGTNPLEISIWTAVSTAGTNPLNQWKMTWSSKGGGEVDTTNLAKLDQVNTFVPLQKIGVEDNKAFIHTSRKGSYDPSDVASPDVLPYSEGELYVREYNNGGAVEHQIWIATSEGDTASWVKIYDSLSNIIQVEARIVELEAYDTTLDIRILELDKSIDALSTTVGHMDSDMTTFDTDLDIVKKGIGNLDGRVNAAELKIAALETHHQTNQETFTTHGSRLDTAEVDVDKVMITSGENRVKITELETFQGTAQEVLDDHESRITSAQSGVSYAIGTSNNNEARITMVEQKVPKIESSIATLTSQGGSHNDRISDAQNDANEAWNKAVTVESIATSNRARIVSLESATVSSFEALSNTPETLTANRYLIVNGDGTAITESTETVQDVQAMSALATGVITGNSLVNAKSTGCDTAITSGNVSQTYFCSSNIVIGTPASGQTRIVSMGEIVGYQSTSVSSTQVREGCQITVVNKGSGVLRLSPPSGTLLFTESSTTATYDIPTNTSVTLFPAIYDSGDKKYILIGKSSAH